MKTRTILPDPLTLQRAGITTLFQAAVLVHLGRCGLHGSTIPEMGAHFSTAVSSVSHALEKCAEAGLVTTYARSNSQGRVRHYTVTTRGWETLTTPADFSLFPQALTRPLVAG
jgi:DNA-binding MarR family transcriptional regulator